MNGLSYHIQVLPINLGVCHGAFFAQLNAILDYLKDPAVLAALQGKLGSMVGQNSGYIQSLPPQVKKR